MELKEYLMLKKWPEESATEFQESYFKKGMHGITNQMIRLLEKYGWKNDAQRAFQEINIIQQEVRDWKRNYKGNRIFIIKQ